MVYKDIDFDQLEEWIESYNKSKQPQKKKQLLTLIVITCSPLVKNIALGLARRSSDPAEDIIQVANVGLIKAIKRYNPKYKNLKAFLSYAIIGEIKHYLRDKINMIKTPREIFELSYRINKVSIEDLEKDGADFDNRLHSKEIEKIEISKERRHLISLDEIIYNTSTDSVSYADIVSYETDEENEETELSLDKEKKELLEDAISKLPDKLKDIIVSIYYKNMVQKELAKAMNTSQSNISRLQKRALTKLYEIITTIQSKG